MLNNIQQRTGAPFKNLQGDQFPQAVIVIEDAKLRKEKVEVTELVITRKQGEHYETEEKPEAGNHEGISDIEYTAQYWTQLQNFQQGRKGYYLEAVGGELGIQIEITDEWLEKYNSIQGTDTQKVTKLCEMHLEQVVIPELRAS